MFSRQQIFKHCPLRPCILEDGFDRLRVTIILAYDLPHVFEPINDPFYSPSSVN
jgi:hypothetical protein